MCGNKCCKGKCVLYHDVMNIINKRDIPKCRLCSVSYLKWEGVWCPCCGQRLSRSAKNSKRNHKNKIRIELNS